MYPWIVTQIPFDNPLFATDFAFETEERAVNFKEKAYINGGGCFHYTDPVFKENTNE